MLRSKLKPFYYWNEEIGHLIKEREKGNYLNWISSSKDPEDRIELRRMQVKIRKMRKRKLFELD